MAVLRALGSKHGYYNPKDFRTAYYNDVVIDGWVEMLDKQSALVLKGGGSEEERQAVIDGCITTHLNLFEA